MQSSRGKQRRAEERGGEEKKEEGRGEESRECDRAEREEIRAEVTRGLARSAEGRRQTNI